MPKLLVTITGPSGSGKSHLIHRQFETDQLLVSMTTRPMRPGEIDGVDYHFVSHDTFQAALQKNKLIQWTEYDGNFYGVSKREALSKLERFDTVVVATVMSSVADFVAFAESENILTLSVFTSISKEALLRNFENRTESDADKQRRIAQYDIEMQNAKNFPEVNILDMSPDDYGATAALKLDALIQIEKIQAMIDKITNTKEQD